MRSQWIGFGLVVSGCLDAAPDPYDMPPPPDIVFDLGTPEPDDVLGDPMVAGDFNGDGFMDLAVGAPGETFQGHGAVLIYKGTSAGLVPWKILSEGDFATTPHVMDDFGRVLASREMNGSPGAELVVGAPGYWAEGVAGSGAIFTYVGSANGPIPGSLITERQAGGVPETNDEFGSAIALGSFDGTSNMVAVSATNEKVGSSTHHTGWVAVYTWIGDSYLAGAKNISPPAGTVEDARFGDALLTMNYNNDNFDDLIIGAPGDGPNAKGIVRTYRGSGNGLSLDQTIATPSSFYGFGGVLAAGKFRCGARPELAISVAFPGSDPFYGGRIHLYMPSSAGVFSHEQTLDFFVGGLIDAPAELGYSMTAGDFDGDGCDELIAGAPRRIDPNGRSGEVVVYHGVPSAPMTTWGTRWIHGESWALGADPEFGRSVAVGDFNRTTPHRLDMAIGAPLANVNGVTAAGLFDEYAGDGTIPNFVATHVEGGH